MGLFQSVHNIRLDKDERDMIDAAVAAGKVRVIPMRVEPTDEEKAKATETNGS
jgi:hypothetical protein